MKLRTTTLAIGVLTAFTFACHRSTTATAPSSTPAGHAAPVSLTIQGPATIAPGQTVQYRAIVTMSDHSTQDDTTTASWFGDPTVVTITNNGQATGVAPGDAFINANIQTTPPLLVPCCSARIAVLVLPPNTYRLTGTVLETGLPVQGANVTVLSGVGSGLSSMTDYNGEYRLYGVAGALQIKMTKPGYADIIKTFTSSQNDVLDFPEAHQLQTLPSLAGAYSLTFQPDPGCPTTPSAPRSLPLPTDVRQPRTYAVQLTQNGPVLHVAGSPPTFVQPSDHFDGRITPDGITFQLDNGYAGYGPDDAMTAHVSSTQALSYEGQVTASRSGSALVGRLDGEIQFFDLATKPQGEVGHCDSANHTFSLTLAPTGPVR
jgi:Big-like domain-containing protein